MRGFWFAVAVMAGSGPVSAQVIFESRYYTGPELEEYAASVVPLEDGFMVSGTISDSTGNGYLLLLRLAENGDVLWGRSYSYLDPINVTSSALVSDVFVVSGVMSPPAFTQGFLSAFDLNGENLWNLIFPDIVSSINSIVPSDSSVIFTGYWYLDVTTVYQVLGEVDLTGALRWGYCYSAPLGPWGLDVDVARDGSNLVAGYLGTLGVSFPIYLAKFGPNGVPLWAVKMSENAYMPSVYCSLLPDGSAVMVWPTWNGNLTKIVKFNGDGNLVAARAFADPLGGVLYPEDLIVGDDGYPLIVFTKPTYVDGSFIVDLKLGDDLGVLKAHYITGLYPLNAHINSGAATDFGYVLAGECTAGAPYLKDVAVATLDQEGSSCLDEEVTMLDSVCEVGCESIDLGVAFPLELLPFSCQEMGDLQFDVANMCSMTPVAEAEKPVNPKVDFRAVGGAGYLVIEADHPTRISVYSVDGRRVFGGHVSARLELPLASGVYIVKSGRYTAKAVVF